MVMEHTCYMEGGSIIAAGRIVEEPAVFVSRMDDTIFAWGNLDIVLLKFRTAAAAYANAGMQDMVEGLMCIELSKYKMSREDACYVIRRMTEFTATGFIKEFCEKLESGDIVAWLEAEKKRIPIDINEKEWRAR